MKVLFDTNVVLDLMLDRTPFADHAAQLFSLVEKGRISGTIGATTVTTIHYLAAKTIGRKRAEAEIEKLLALFDIAAVTRSVLEKALVRSWPDFEDAVLHEAALHANARAIVTRDAKGFTGAQLSVFSPEELLHLISAGDTGRSHPNDPS